MARCPICGSDRFQMMTRTLARQIQAGAVPDNPSRRAQKFCSGCGSRPRARLIFAALQALDLLRPEKRVLHIAAEPVLLPRFKETFGENYTVANLSLDAMSGLEGVNKMTLDMCSAEPTSTHFDIVIHSHVLEHVHCNWALALMRLNRLLSDSGVHVFCIPIHNEGYYKEDLDPGLPESVRIEQFGKDDHVRNFIRGPFIEEVTELCRLTGFEVRQATDILGPQGARRVAGSGQVFIMQRAAGTDVE